VGSIKRVNNKVATVEGFDVVIEHPGGPDVRSDRSGGPTYPYENGAKNHVTGADSEGKKVRTRLSRV
jgi:hypothetical protein